MPLALHGQGSNNSTNRKMGNLKPSKTPQTRQVVDLEEMHNVIVSKIQSLRKIAFNLEAQIAEKEAMLNQQETEAN